MNGQVQIQFLNHASVKIITDTVTLVSDPWFSGSIFNNGWELLWSSDELFTHAADSDYVWISHEHPDHFSPQFFRRVDPETLEVIFQKTRDGRLARYLRERGFVVHERQHHERFWLSGREQFMIGKNGFYDSWSFFESADTRILNINDCILKTAADLRTVRKLVGQVDVLLTQFSYAGWVGDRTQKRLREQAAQRRLDVVRRQIEYLEPRHVIPFASFTAYCHEENSYLNDSVNRIPDFLNVCANMKTVPIVMKPMDTWCVGKAWDNGPATDFWEQQYSRVPSMELRTPRGIDFAVLSSECSAYQARVFEKNSRRWMKMLSALPFFQFFNPVHIRLTDLNITVRFSFFDDLRIVGDGHATDIEMASDSLSFIFNNEFGFDTLLVNARCNANKRGLDRAMKNFAIGNLNAMGASIGLGMLAVLLQEFRLVWLVVRELKHVNPE